MENKKIIPELGDEIPESWLKLALAEINQKERIIVVPLFRGEQNVELKISKPTMEVDSKCSKVYATYYSRYLQDPDLMTKEQMLEILKKRSIWGQEQEDQVDTLRSKMQDLQYAAAEAKRKGKYSKSSMKKLEEDWLNLRSQVNELLQFKNSHLSATIEGLAEEEEIKVKLSLCVKYPDGRLVWNSVDEVNKDDDKQAVMFIFTEAMTFWVGLSQEIIKGLPAKFLVGGESEDLQEA